jgi:hypothetical protein
MQEITLTNQAPNKSFKRNRAGYQLFLLEFTCAALRRGVYHRCKIKEGGASRRLPLFRFYDLTNENLIKPIWYLRKI